MKRRRHNLDLPWRVCRLEQFEYRALLAGDAEPEGTASLSGNVYLDHDLSGAKDVSESGLEGITITLTGIDELQQDVLRTTVTDEVGAFQFVGLRAGTYALTQTPSGLFPDGKDSPGTVNGLPQGATAPPYAIVGIGLEDGQAGVDFNFAELPAGVIAGFVYSDRLNDGPATIEDNHPLAGVHVSLTGVDYANNSIEMSAVTTSNGFDFLPLPPGTYRLVVRPRDGYLMGKVITAGQEVALTNGQVAIVLPVAGGVFYDFAQLVASSLSGFVFKDFNTNGVVENDESGIASVVVTLTGEDDLGAVHRTTMTDAAGHYRFDDVRPGTYSIEETQPLEYLDSRDSVGTIAGTPHGSVTNDRISGIVVGQGNQGLDYNFGEVPPQTISGFVYEDANDDNIYNPGEVGTELLGSQPIMLELKGVDDLGADVHRVTQAGIGPGGHGSYAFTRLRPGTYSVAQLNQPVGFLDGPEQVGKTDGETRGIAGDDVISGILVAEGEHSVGHNFAEQRSASIGGFVFLDDDNDAQRTDTESGLANFRITLTGQRLGGQSVTETTTSGPDGSYVFDDLRPGKYSITKLQRAAFLDGQEFVPWIDGMRHGVVNSPHAYADIPLRAGQNFAEYNFGQLLHSSLGGSVFVDVDDDGVRDAGELGIPNVELRLAGENDLGQDIERITRTSRTGEYSFSSLRPGTYTIAEVQPGQFLDGRDSTDLAGAAVGDDIISGMVVVSGTQSLANHFGELRLGEPFAGPTLTAPRAFQNPVLPTDVDDDLVTIPLDVLIVINALNAATSPELPTVRGSEEYIDVNGDSLLTALDALLIINWLNDLADAGRQALPAQRLTADEAFALAVDQALRQTGSEEDDVVNPLALRSKLPR